VPSGHNATLQVAPETVISLTAVPDSQHIFQGWGDGYGGSSLIIGNSTTASTTATVNASGGIIATFAPAPAPTTITVTPSSSPVTQYNAGSGVTITVTVIDQYSHPMPGARVSLSASLDGSLSSSSLLTDSSGKATSYLTVTGTVTSQFAVTVTAQASNGIQGQATVIFLPAPPKSFTVTFSAGGLGHDALGPVLTVDGSGYFVNQLPIQFNWNTNSRHAFVWTSMINGSNGNDEYVWQSTSGCGLSSHSGNVTASSSCVMSAVYSPMYQVTFVVNPATDGKISWSGTGVTSGSTTTSASPFLQAGATVSISATSSSKLTFQSWSSTSSINILVSSSSTTTAAINGPGTITSNFANATVQTVSITFAETGLGSSSGTVLTVDGTSYTLAQIKPFSWVVGSQHSYVWTSTVSGTSTTSYIWQSTTGCGQSSQAGGLTTGSSSCTVSAVYKSASATGSLTITISGLPANQSVGVLVTGPSNFNKQITIAGGQKQTVTTLVPGTYSVIGGIASGWQTNQGSIQVNVLAGQTASATIQYNQVAIAIKQVQLAVVSFGQTANGPLGFSLTATVLGNNGEGMSGQEVQFITSMGTLSSLFGVTNSGGLAATQITSTQTGVATIQATAGGVYSPAISVTFKHQQSCQVVLSESGLPLSGNPTYWAMSIDGKINNESVQSDGDVFDYNVSCGIHYYAVTSPWSSAFYSTTYVTSFSSPVASGEVDLSNQSVADLVFKYVPATTTLIFQESGLGAGVPWSVGVTGTATTQTTAASLQFPVATGDVQFTVNPSAELNSVTMFGSCNPIQNTELSVTGTCIVTLNFAKVQYALNFQALGLPPGMSFSVVLNGGKLQSPLNQFLVNDGSYSFAVFVSGIPATLQTGMPNFQNPVVNGTVLVDGSSVNVQVQFNLQTFVWSSNGTLQPQNCAITTSSQNCVLYASVSSDVSSGVNQSSLITSIQVFDSGVSILQDYFLGVSQTIQQMIEALLYSAYFT